MRCRLARKKRSSQADPSPCDDLYPEAKHDVFCPPVMSLISTTEEGGLNRKALRSAVGKIFVRAARSCDGFPGFVAAYAWAQRAGPAPRPGAGPAPTAPTTSNSLRILPKRSYCTGENPAAALGEISLPDGAILFWQFVAAAPSQVTWAELPS